MRLPAFLCLALLTGPLFASITVPKKSLLPDFSALTTGADTILLYEGLPHRVFEKEAFRVEQSRQSVFTEDRDCFYQEPLPLRDETKAKLTRIFHATGPTLPWRGEKLCGGFHADYLIEWRRAEKPLLRVLVCFGCGELKLRVANFGRYDLTKEGEQALRAALKGYRQHRPIVPPATPLSQVKSIPATFLEGLAPETLSAIGQRRPVGLPLVGDLPPRPSSLAANAYAWCVVTFKIAPNGSVTGVTIIQDTDRDLELPVVVNILRWRYPPAPVARDAFIVFDSPPLEEGAAAATGRIRELR